MILFYIKDNIPALRGVGLWQDAAAIIEREKLAAGEWALVVNDKIVKPFNVTHCPVCHDPLDKEDDRPMLFNNGVLHVSCVKGLI